MNAKLSPRESAIVDWLLKDLHDREIAERLGISKGTVRTMMQRAMFKTGTRSRLGLAIWAARNMSSKVWTHSRGHAGRKKAA